MWSKTEKSLRKRFAFMVRERLCKQLNHSRGILEPFSYSYAAPRNIPQSVEERRNIWTHRTTSLTLTSYPPRRIVDCVWRRSALQFKNAKFSFSWSIFFFSGVARMYCVNFSISFIHASVERGCVWTEYVWNTRKIWAKKNAVSRGYITDHFFAKSLKSTV